MPGPLMGRASSKTVAHGPYPSRRSTCVWWGHAIDFLDLCWHAESYMLLTNRMPESLSIVLEY